MDTLTETYIKDLVWSYHNILAQGKHLDPRKYKHPLREVVVNNRLKRALGRANNRGKLEIAGFFVGLEKTKENFDQLSDTILHELAHLYVGIAEGHNDTWKSTASSIGASPESGAYVTGSLQQASRPPWLLVATLSTGKTVNCKTAHRRTMKYLRSPSAYNINGVTVHKFEWVKLSKKVA